MAKKKNKNDEVRTRRALMNLLKQNGPQDAALLAKQLGVSAMAVRQHLYELQEQGLTTASEEQRQRGRPAKMWQLTDKANEFFPDAHAELTVGLLGAINDAFGSEGLDKLLQIRSRQQIKNYRAQMPKRPSLRRSLQSLAEMRTHEGYMAEVQKDESGRYLLIENHCPICAAATSCTGLCSAELEVFQSVLGKGVQVSRIEHIVSGARRCVYRVEKC